MKGNGIKTFFFSIIFLFSTALGYFSADYMRDALHMEFFVALLIFGAVYAIAGIAVVRIAPVSLGFLFAADVLILHTLIEEYGGIDAVYKTIIIGVLLVAAYLFALLRLGDNTHDGHTWVDVDLKKEVPPAPPAHPTA